MISSTHLSVGGSAAPWVGVAEVGAALDAARGAISALVSVHGDWAALGSADLGAAFGLLVRLRALAEGAAAALLIEANQRGVVQESTAAHAAGWARAYAEEAEAPLTPAVAAQFQRVAQLAHLRASHLDPLVAAVVRGEVAVATAGRLSEDLGLIAEQVPEGVAVTAMAALLECAARGDSPRDLRAAREAVIANYGDESRFQAEQERAHRHREMTPWARDALGRWVASIAVDNHGHAIIDAALTALSAPRRAASPGAFSGADRRAGADLEEPDERTPAQRRADALVELCRVLASSPGLLSHDPAAPATRLSRPGAAHKAQIIVTMGLEELVARTGHGVDDQGNVLTATAVRQLACDARVIPAVLGGAGVVLELGRSARTASVEQVTALRLRDRGCTFPGCDRPASWCQAHHLVHWADGGSTDLDNLALLCERHHTVVHRLGYHGAVVNGHIRWQPPPPRVRPHPAPVSRAREPAA